MTASLSNSSLQTVKPSSNSAFATKITENDFALTTDSQADLRSRAGDYCSIATKYVTHIDEFFATRAQAVSQVSTFIGHIKNQADEIHIHAHNRAYDVDSSTVKIFRQLAFIKQVLPSEVSNEFERSYDRMDFNAQEKTLQTQLIQQSRDGDYLIGKVGENFKAI